MLNKMNHETSMEMSAEEIAQYDRQIRLWGMDAQKQLGKSKVLIVGITGIGSEVTKNIALAGVKAITLMDSYTVTKEDLNSQLLITPAHLGSNRAEASRARTYELNPNVLVYIDKDPIESKDDDFFKEFDVVCLTKCTKKIQQKINLICRMNHVKFFCGGVFGFFGYCFIDIGVHNFVKEKEILKKTESKPSTTAASIHKKEEYEKVLIKQKEEFCSLEESFMEDWSKRTKRDLKYSSSVYFIVQAISKFYEDFNRYPNQSDKDIILKIIKDILSQAGLKTDFVPSDFVNFCFLELSPVCAIVGGVLSQEIIKALTHRDLPHNNYFFYNGLNHSGIVDNICPVK